ncbi:hypothetical protein [[Scytonema hofmanni] UTEX B 1581]|nr:hypothetical protein [[Scytonema hofmanni] UTEX B 1581]
MPIAQCPLPNAHCPLPNIYTLFKRDFRHKVRSKTKTPAVDVTY